MKYFLILLIILFTSCSQETQSHKLKIATNSWIGYVPLFYAKEKGYLNKLDIQLIINVSLAESAEIFNIGRADMVTTTQHEYHTLKENYPSLVPVILIDRSYGGDMILSNRTIEELQTAKEIYAYLEIDSINSEILKTFLKKHNIQLEKLIFINQDQAKIQNVENISSKNILIVTYVPYNISLLKKGFKELVSTKKLTDIIIIDSLCATKEKLQKYHEQIKKLKAVIDSSIKEIEQNPKESHKLVKNYIGNISYTEYLDALQTIKWLNNPSKELLNKLKTIGYEKQYIIK